MITYVMKAGRLQGTYKRRQRYGALFQDGKFLRLCTHEDYVNLITTYPQHCADDKLSWQVINVLELDKLNGS